MSRRSTAIGVAVAVILAGVCFFVLPKLAWWYVTQKYVRIWEREKRPALVAAAEAAQPIIDALDAWKGDHGRYPDELQALAPVYLDTVPEPQAPLRGEWCYGPLEDGREFYLFAHPPDNYYGVPIQAPTDAEVFIYESNGRYDRHPWSLRDGDPREETPLTRIGAWAYYAHSTTPPREG